jgi:hypothetical protein
MFLKVATVLVLLTILVQAKPVEKSEALHDPFALGVKKFVSGNDFNAFCDLTEQIQSILYQTKKKYFLQAVKVISENDVKALRDLNRHMQSFLTETKMEEDQKVIDLTDPTPFRTEIEQESQLMCDGCEVDYKEENESETREEFAQVPVKVEAASYYRPEVRFERSDFGVVFLVGLVFLAVMLLICNC